MVEVVARYGPGPGEPYARVKLSDGRVLREHRFVMEQKLGRRLAAEEHVHHKDEDRQNNSPDNLELTSSTQHTQHHHPKSKRVVLICPVCARTFERSPRYIRTKEKLGQRLFLCGRSCRPKRKGL